MNMYEQYYRDMCSGYWAEEDVENCPCHGNGWVCSEVDTWHKCKYHFNNQHHPDHEYDDEENTCSCEHVTEQVKNEAVPQQYGYPSDSEDDIPF
jgi:hypothetical protein